MKRLLLLITLFAGLSLTGISSAQDDNKTMPTKGTTNYATYYTTQTLSDLKMGETGYQWVQEMVGITHNTDGEPLFDNMSVSLTKNASVVDHEVTWEFKQ